jgi:hypothetical protein
MVAPFVRKDVWVKVPQGTPELHGPSGGTGRRDGFKIRCPERDVSVRLRPWAPVVKHKPENKLELIYLAAPYSHPDPKVVEERIAEICRVDAVLMSRGTFTFSPLLKHFVKDYANLPGDWNYWQDYCRVTLPKCSQVYVLALDGWEDSVGVREEMKLAELLKIPVFLCGPDGFRITKLV